MEFEVEAPLATGKEAVMVGVMGEYGGAAGDGGRGSCWLSFGCGEENDEVGRGGRGIANAMCSEGA